jgi:hypothetical protein
LVSSELPNPAQPENRSYERFHISQESALNVTLGDCRGRRSHALAISADAVRPKVWREAQGGIMPLHYGKIFGIIALLTILAFVLWQLWIALFAGEAFDKKVAPPHAEAPLIEMARA